jgi:hypothetical protein
LRPAAFFCADVPPCFELDRDDEPDPDFLPPRLDAPGELEILAARSFDIPLSFSFSYCFSFFTLGRLFGMSTPCRFRSGFPRAVSHETAESPVTVSLVGGV